MRYIPLTQKDEKEMLETIGASSVSDLFASIPKDIQPTSPLDLPSAKSEQEQLRYFQTLAAKNKHAGTGHQSYLGGGAYDHYIPSVVDALSSRGEFLTAYTPYQPEISQGTLQSIFEFQSMIANLFSLPVANASMYDGASATAEAALMAFRVKRKAKMIYLSASLHPEYREVVENYLQDLDVEIQTLPTLDSGQTDHSKIDSTRADVAGVIVQQPNFYGVVEDLDEIETSIRPTDGLFVVTTTEPIAFGLLKGPGEQGADIVTGEGQSFGNPLSYGGPYVGLFATRKEYVRQMPGRLVGKTKDMEGRTGYVLTLATREQHIRRDRATSNICTNHSLCALRASIYLASLGGAGLRQTALRNVQLCQQLKAGISKMKGVSVSYSSESFNEFVLSLPMEASDFCRKMEEKNILAGIPFVQWDKKRKDEILVTITETKSEEDIEAYVNAAKAVLG